VLVDVVILKNQLLNCYGLRNYNSLLIGRKNAEKFYVWKIKTKVYWFVHFVAYLNLIFGLTKTNIYIKGTSMF
jgi:hypothetical protein